MIIYGELEVAGEGVVVDYCKVLSHFLGGTKETHEYQSGTPPNIAWYAPRVKYHSA
jgi:hypothetical protein